MQARGKRHKYDGYPWNGVAGELTDLFPDMAYMHKHRIHRKGAKNAKNAKKNIKVPKKY